jgi:hypothetical protein
MRVCPFNDNLEGQGAGSVRGAGDVQDGGACVVQDELQVFNPRHLAARRTLARRADLYDVDPSGPHGEVVADSLALVHHDTRWRAGDRVGPWKRLHDRGVVAAHARCGGKHEPCGGT